MIDLMTVNKDATPETIARLIESIPYAQFLGIRMDKENGTLTAHLPFQEMLIGNPLLPAIHGGVIGALLETTAIVQLLVETDSEKLPKPVDISIDYLRSGKPVDTYAAARVTKQGRRVANVQGQAWQEDPARPIAAIHGHFLLTPHDEART